MERLLLLTILLGIVKFQYVLASVSCSPLINEVKPQIGLLVSPILSRKTIREIEVYWTNLTYRTGDAIALYTEKPSASVQPIYTVEVDGPNGIKKTGIQAEFLSSSNLTFVQQCLKYHVAWLRDGVVQQTNCLKTQPGWMHANKDILGPLTMSKVFVPGSHNSAAYALHEQQGAESFIEKYAITQDLDILSQLILGVRYLDIRVGYYPNTEEVWFTNHGIYRSVPLRTVIDQVKTFLDNTQEIVIFDVQEFPVGFGTNLTVHRKLVNYLEREFIGYNLPKGFGWTTNLNSIWSSGRRLIIGYDKGQIVAQYDYVWPCVTQQWGNVREIEDLFDYLDKIEKTYPGMNRITPRSAMAQLTANTLDVVLNRLGGLRKMAENVNFNVTNWYRTLWQDSANVVSVDFLRSTDIVDVAIEANYKRHLYCRQI